MLSLPDDFATRKMPLLRLTGDGGGSPHNQNLAPPASDSVRVVLNLPAEVAKGGFVVSVLPAGNPESVPVPAVLSKIGPAGRPVTAALDAWVAHLLGRGKRDRSVRSYRRKVEECARACGWLTAADVRLQDAEGWLAGKRAGEGGCEAWGGSTADHATSILRRFGAWLHREDGLPENPLAHLESSGEQGGDGSRALTVGEVQAMIQAARRRAAGDKRQRADAALYFAFLALTGLRDGEAGRCCWRDIDLDGEPPAIYTDPAWAKNRRKMRVVLNDEIRGLLLAHRERTGGVPTERVFASKPNQRTWHLLRELAGVALRDGRGRVASYHSLRKFWATALDATGATAGVVSRLTRHAKDLAQRTYIDPDWSKEMAAVQALPKIFVPDSGFAQGVGLQSTKREGTFLAVAAKHSVGPPMVCQPHNHDSDALGSPVASERLAAQGDHQGLPNASDSSIAVGTDNGPSNPRLPDLGRGGLADLLDAQASQLASLARILRAGGGA